MCPGCGQIRTKARCVNCYKWRGGKRNTRKIPPESETETSEQSPLTVSHTFLQPEYDDTAALSASLGRVSTLRQPHVNTPSQPISGGRDSCEATPLTSHEYSVRGDSKTCS